jgi:hypothetical protein
MLHFIKCYYLFTDLYDKFDLLPTIYAFKIETELTVGASSVRLRQF